MKIKKILSEFAGWVLAVLTFLGTILIFLGLGLRGRNVASGETNWYFVAIGVVLILPFVIYLIKITLLLRKTADANSVRIHQLLKTGDKLKVDLDNLKIQTNSYQQEISVGSGYRKRKEQVDVNHNVILLEIPYQNEVIKYKINIDMEPIKLRMHFAVKEQTTLYVDAQNPNNNFLDLRFLES